MLPGVLGSIYLQVFQQPVGKVINPTMDTQLLAAFPGFLNGGGVADVPDLLLDV